MPGDMISPTDVDQLRILGECVTRADLQDDTQFPNPGQADGFEMELDFYIGYASSFAGIDWFVQPIYYFFPGAEDISRFDVRTDRTEIGVVSAEKDYLEIWFGASRAFPMGDAVDAIVNLLYAFSPDFTEEDGVAHYVNVSAGFSLPGGFSIDGGYGYQDVEGGRINPDGYDYAEYNAGIGYDLWGFSLDLRYHDTNSDGTAFYGEIADSRVVFSASASF